MMVVKNFEQKLEIAKERIALAVQEVLKDKLTPAWGVDTGYLKTHVKAKVVGNEIIITMPKTGLYIEYGTPPHIIEAKDAKVLAASVTDYTRGNPSKIANVNPYGSGKFPMFSKDGKYVLFGKRVKHPGTRPFPFIRNTFDQELIDITVDKLNKSFK